MMDDRIKELAEKAGAVYFAHCDYWMTTDLDIELFAKLATEAEREACAKACENQAKDMLSLIGLPVVTSEIIQRDRADQWSKCAAAIRARGDNHD